MIFNVNSGKGKDENLVPENIKNGVIIDDVVGTYSGEVLMNTFVPTIKLGNATISNPLGKNINGAILYIDSDKQISTNNAGIVTISIVKTPSGKFRVTYCGSGINNNYTTSLIVDDPTSSSNQVYFSGANYNNIVFRYLNGSSVSSGFLDNYHLIIW